MRSSWKSISLHRRYSGVLKKTRFERDFLIRRIARIKPEKLKSIKSKKKFLTFIKHKPPVYYSRDLLIDDVAFYKGIKPQIHNGRFTHRLVLDSSEYLNHRLGEFSRTRTPFLHRRSKKKKKSAR